jgi:MoaA/NifB/PqqE/SkfB family radical SAM enzyme
MANMITNLFKRPKSKRFSAWQIELTTRCALQCTMCVRQEYKGQQRKDMVLADFKKIVPYLKDVESVVLEGWGESLLHGNLTECIELIRKEGAKAGFVTSGMGLDEEYVLKLSSAGLDFIGFSLSGATSETHNKIRINSDFDKLIGSIKLFKNLPAGGHRPKMHIVYLMLKDNMEEVALLPDLAREVGASEIVLINIIQITNAWQAEQKAFSYDQAEPFKEVLKQAERRAKALGIGLIRSALSPREVAICTENPLKNLYISVEGDVSPCVHLYPAAPSPFRRLYCGEEHCTEKVTFGNIFREPFEPIWNRREYVEFRDKLARRQDKAEQNFRALLDGKKADSIDLPALPAQCRTCHKMLGV